MERLGKTLIVAGVLVSASGLCAAELPGGWNRSGGAVPPSDDRRSTMYPGALDRAPGDAGEEDQKDEKPEELKKNDAVALPLRATQKDGVEVRKVVAPADKYLYLSAKKLECAGGESIEEAMSIYRMALHNGAKGRASDEAYLGLARCEYARGDYWQAFRAVESSYPQEFDRAELDLRSRMELELGKLLMQRAGQPVAGALDKDGKTLNGYQTAEIVFESVVYNDPKSVLAPQALRHKAQCQKELRRYEDAKKSYYMLTNSYPFSPEKAQASLELIELMALMTKDTGGIKPADQERVVNILRSNKASSNNADPAFREKITQAETAVKENQATARLGEAKFYLKRGGDKANAAAKFMLEDILRHYPDAAAAKEAQELLHKMNGGKGGRNK